MAHGFCSAIGYFFGRLNSPSELTIAFLGENEDLVFGLASILDEIGPENLKVKCCTLPNGLAEITVFDKRDPDNFSDSRKRPLEHIARFINDLQEDKKFIITVGDLNLNMNYQVLRMELDDVELVTEYLH
ncbi:MAG: hypothetical protein RO469_06930 [Thermincola sp.]|nr:hypothetical protein [Thermincola sp.]MDT3702586.1 hypothetical protein [Thermincola sp.]